MKILSNIKEYTKSALKWAGLVTAIVAGLNAFMKALPDSKDTNEKN